SISPTCSASSGGILSLERPSGSSQASWCWAIRWPTPRRYASACRTSDEDSLQVQALDVRGIHVLADRENLAVLDVHDPTVAIVVSLAVLETTGAMGLGDDLIAFA